MHGVLRTSGQALDAARCAGQRRKHEHQNQREAELCVPLHLVQCSAPPESEIFRYGDFPDLEIRRFLKGWMGPCQSTRLNAATRGPDATTERWNR